MSYSSKSIRAATAADRDRIIPVVNAAFAVEDFFDVPRTDQQDMAQLMQTGTFLILEDGADRVLASIYVELRGERGYFGMLAVDPARQGMGLSRVMVEAAESHCRDRGCQHMDIAVLSPRSALVPFYNKLGYVETAREPFAGAHLVKPGVECHSIVMSIAPRASFAAASEARLSRHGAERRFPTQSAFVHRRT
jgi:GNAT superfamily N-acetyltransferase